MKTFQQYWSERRTVPSMPVDIARNAWIAARKTMTKLTPEECEALQGHLLVLGYGSGAPLYEKLELMRKRT